MIRAWWWAVLVAAVAGAVLPVPAGAVEWLYSRSLYPHFQRMMTSVSNLVPVALFDGLCVAAIVTFALYLYRTLARVGVRHGTLRVAVTLLRSAALLYLVFLTTWGLNYRRVPLIQKVDFDASRVTGEAASALLVRAIAETNRTYAAAHARPTPLSALADAFHRTQASLSSAAPIVPGRPKQTLLGGYFHQTSISGMTDPFFLETLVAPDLLEVERPFVIAHEWAHLAGYADESEANFIAWLTCLHADDAARYSGWLAMLGYVPAQRGALAQLGPGPRLDLFAIRYRYLHTSRLLRTAAQQGYDKYLKANRVEAGVASYDLVLQLVLGTRLDEAANPVLR